MRKAWVWGAAVVALLVLAWLLWPEDRLQVGVATVGKGLVEQVVSNTRAGTLQACQRSRLSMPMGGRVERLHVKEGDRVTRGAVLLELWNDDREAYLEQAGAALDATRRREEQACLTAAQNARDAERARTLLAEQLIAQDAADQTQTRADVAGAACSAARADLASAAAQQRVQQALLEETRLRAPFAGIVAEINGEIGEYVTPSPPGVPTPPAVDLIDDSCLYVTAPIDEVDAAAVRVGLPARITLDAFRGQAFTGKVTRIAPYVLDLEKQARTVDVDVRFDSVPAEVALLAGYSADVDIILDSHADVVRVPAEALRDGERVLVRDGKSGVLEERTVTIGLANWTWSEVTAGLAAGEQVVTTLDRAGVAAGVATDVDP